MQIIATRHIRMAAALIAFAPAVAAAAEEHGGAGMPQLEISTYPGQIFWLAVSFAVLFLVMWKVALPRVSEVLEARQQKVSQDLERAEEMKAEAERIVAEYEQALDDARAKAQDTIRKAQEKINADLAKREEAFEEELSGRIAEAEKKIESARKAALKNVEQIAIEAATASVEKLGGKADEKAIKAAIDAAAKEA